MYTNELKGMEHLREWSTDLDYEPIYSLPGCIEYDRGHKGPPKPCTILNPTATVYGVQQLDVRHGCWRWKVPGCEEG